MANEVLAFLAGMTLAILSNIIPSLPEQREILASGDDSRIAAVRDAWVFVAILAGVAIGLMLAAGYHHRKVAI